MRLILFAFAILLSMIAPAAADIVDVRAAPTGNGALLAVDLTEAGQYKTFALANPPRVVIDLPKAGWRAHGLRDLPKGVTRLRHGYFNPNVYRLVFDLDRAAKIIANDRAPARKGVDSILIEVAFNGTAPATTPVEAAAPTKAPLFPALAILDQLRDTAPAHAQPPPPQPLPQLVAITPPKRPKPVIAAPVTAPPIMLTPVVTQSSTPTAKGPPLPPIRPLTRTVMIDPGHGGVDPGAIGHGGVKEKKVNLAVARAIQRALEARPGYEAVLTRDRDIFLRLRERVRRGRNAQADLFISIHADSHPDRDVSGASLYTLSERASDAEAARLARAENKADLIGGAALKTEPEEVYGILLDLAQRETKNRSSSAADDILFALASNQPLLVRPKRSAGFAVLKAPDVPSILIELGFLSNPNDARRLGSPNGRTEIARSIAEGIVRHFEGANTAHAQVQSNAQARLPEKR